MVSEGMKPFVVHMYFINQSIVIYSKNWKLNVFTVILLELKHIKVLTLT